VISCSLARACRSSSVRPFQYLVANWRNWLSSVTAVLSEDSDRVGTSGPSGNRSGVLFSRFWAALASDSWYKEKLSPAVEIRPCSAGSQAILGVAKARTICTATNRGQAPNRRVSALGFLVC